MLVIGFRVQDPGGGGVGDCATMAAGAPVRAPLWLRVTLPVPPHQRGQFESQHAAGGPGCLGRAALDGQPRVCRQGGRPLSVWAAMLQTRERRTRNRMLLQTAEALRDGLKGTEEMQRVKVEKPYDLLCRRSSSVVLCGRKRVFFDPDKVIMNLCDDWRGPAVPVRAGGARGVGKAHR